MLASASRGGPAARNFYVCSSCLLTLNSRNPSERLQIDLQHPTRVSHFSTTRANYNVEEECENSNDGPAKAVEVKHAEHFKESQTPLSKSKATLVALRALLRAEDEARLSMKNGNEMENGGEDSKATLDALRAVLRGGDGTELRVSTKKDNKVRGSLKKSKATLAELRASLRAKNSPKPSKPVNTDSEPDISRGKPVTPLGNKGDSLNAGSNTELGIPAKSSSKVGKSGSKSTKGGKKASAKISKLELSKRKNGVQNDTTKAQATSTVQKSKDRETQGVNSVESVKASLETEIIGHPEISKLDPKSPEKENQKVATKSPSKRIQQLIETREKEVDDLPNPSAPASKVDKTKGKNRPKGAQSLSSGRKVRALKIKKHLTPLTIRRIVEPTKSAVESPNSELERLLQSETLSNAARTVVLKALRIKSDSPSKSLTLKDALQRPSGSHSRRTVSKTEASENGVSKTRARAKTNIEEIPKRMQGHDIETVSAANLVLTPVDKGKLDVPSLSYGLERVLFNPGVYQLQDPRSRVFNFDPYLQTIMPVSEFDFSALKAYITSSRDETLLSRAKQEGKKYTGSTSSMSSSLAHFHFLLSQWRPVNTSGLSKVFPVEYDSFTSLQRAPVAIFLRWKDGVYAIDADKQYDSGNILMSLGKSMEKLLTMPTEDFERYRKENSHQVTEAERNDPEPFHYSTLGDFLLRSQLDAHDPRLPGTGMFDLKTRAVISIRMDTSEYEVGRGYEIRSRHGEWGSYEREYYDMIRSAFLKYSMQVRMGRMDGIFVAFHNTERIFGFQYISLSEMDYCIHGTEDITLGDSEFKLSLDLFNRVLDRATAKFPEKTLRLHFETRAGATPFMYIYAEPIEDEEVERIQNSNRAEIEKFEKEVLGLGVDEDGWASMQDNVEKTMVIDEIAPEGLNEDSKESSVAWNDPRSTGNDDNEDINGEYDRDDELEANSDKESAPNSELLNEFNEGIGEDNLLDKDMRPEILEYKGEGADGSEGVSAVEGGDEVEEGAPFTSAQFDSSSLVEDGTESEDSWNQDVTKVSTDENDNPAKPLLAMTLTVRNKVNGQYIERPEELTKDDDWVVEYSLAEIDDPQRAQNLLRLTKKRRSAVFKRDFDITSDKWNDKFIKNIQKHIEEGRKYREAITEIEKDQPKKVL